MNRPQLVINTAIVYMHRFFMFHSFKDVHKHLLAQSAIFLAAKVEDQPRKLEHVIRVAQACLAPREAPLNPKHLVYLQKAQDLIMLETMLLQTLGFDVTVVHPHTHVVKCSQLVRASKDLAHTSYFMATNRWLK
uniref:Cyclin N-terminal domain-containing protein n=1 Tax=Petromyzon marinus TaxID=7757 RepID=S4RQM9_PETMA